MYGWDILCGISKGTFEIPHKICYPYIQRCKFYTTSKCEELLRACKCFWNPPSFLQYTSKWAHSCRWDMWGQRRGHLKNAHKLMNYDLINLTLLNFFFSINNTSFSGMGKLFCVEFQRVPLKFHTKYLAHTLKDAIFIQCWKLVSSHM